MKRKASFDKTLFLFAALIIAATGLAGCNSQMDDLGNIVVRATTTNPGGIYLGSLTPQLSATPVPVVALIDDADPELFVIYAADGSFLASGLLTTVNTGLFGQSRYFSQTASATTTSSLQTLSLNLTYEPQIQIGGQYTRMDSSGAILETGTLNLNYQSTTYATASALTNLQGVWSNIDAFGTAETSFSLDDKGGVFGIVMATDCTYNGQASVVDQRFNVYRIALTETCGSSGTLPLNLTGLATLLPATSATAGQPQLVLALAAPTAARLFRLSPG